MTRIGARALRFIAAAAVGTGCFLVDERALVERADPLVSSAEARIGRPATPMSYAGVARRTTRRAVAVGAAAGAAGARCVQVVDAYGRIYTRCY